MEKYLFRINVSFHQGLSGKWLNSPRICAFLSSKHIVILNNITCGLLLLKRKIYVYKNKWKIFNFHISNRHKFYKITKSLVLLTTFATLLDLTSFKFYNLLSLTMFYFIKWVCHCLSSLGKNRKKIIKYCFWKLCSL